MGKYMDENLKVIQKALKGFNPTADPKFISAVSDLASDIMEWVMANASFDSDEDTGVPVFTKNLLDSIGIGIYYNGAMVALRTTPQALADEPQKFRGQEYMGRDKLQDALNAATDLGSGLTMRIFSASPISEMINEQGSPIDRGQGYFDRIAEYATQLATSRFKL